MDEGLERRRADRMRHLRRGPAVDVPYVQRVNSARTLPVESIDYLGIIRRRWTVIVVLALTRTRGRLCDGKASCGHDSARRDLSGNCDPRDFLQHDRSERALA